MKVTTKRVNESGDVVYTTKELSELLQVTKEAIYTTGRIKGEYRGFVKTKLNNTLYWIKPNPIRLEAN